MAFQDREDTYLRHIRRFLASEVGGDSFCREFMDMWRADRDEVYARSESWPERYDLQLVEACNRLEITPEEFGRKWAELWGYAGAEPLHLMLDHIFSACDAYDADPEGEYEIGEGRLRGEVEAAVAAYESGKSYRGG